MTDLIHNPHPINPPQILGRERAIVQTDGGHLVLADDNGGADLSTLSDAELAALMAEWAAWRREQDRLDAMHRQARQWVKAVRRYDNRGASVNFPEIPR